MPAVVWRNWGTSFAMEGQAKDARRPNTKYNDVGPGFFAKTGIPLVAGRDTRETDTAAAPKMMVVNETFVKQVFSGRNPIDHRVAFGKDCAPDTEIVGVIKGGHYSSVRQQPPPVFFRPWRQDPKRTEMFFFRWKMFGRWKSKYTTTSGRTN